MGPLSAGSVPGARSRGLVECSDERAEPIRERLHGALQGFDSYPDPFRVSGEVDGR